MRKDDLFVFAPPKTAPDFVAGRTLRPERACLARDGLDPIAHHDFLTGLPVLGESELYDDICDRLDATNDGQRAGAIELSLEGLYLARRISKESDRGETVYG